MGKIREVGSFEAKTKFSELIESVRLGDEIMVTNRGVAVARIVPISTRRSKLDQLLPRFDAIRSRSTEGPSIRELRDEGRP